MKRALSFLGLLGALLGVLALVISFPVESSYRGKAVLAQRVEKDEAAGLFGEALRPIGTPQMLIIEDKAAFLPEPNAEGVKQVSEDYLKEKGIYPLQFKTIEFFIGNARLAAGFSILAGGLLWFFLRRRA